MSSRIATLVFAMVAATPAFAQDFQVGARAKGMGGSYTAFEDDPTSIWMNPAGIATQPTQFGLVYQSYTQYEADFTETSHVGDPEIGVIDPQLLPSFQGFVFQIGTAKAPMAVGVGYIRPVHIKMTYDPDQPSDGVMDDIVEQQFSRLRISFARDFLKEDATGFMNHLAVGVAVDLGFTKWEDRSIEVGGVASNKLDKDTSSRFGFGLGLLAGLYDNTEDFKLLFGIAYQSAMDFKLSQQPSLFPIWQWPTVTSVGLTAYFFQGLPLRATVDVQLVDWDGVLEPAAAATGRPSMRSVRAVSFGMEYKYQLRGQTYLYPRLGMRTVQAPWDDKNNLPAMGTHTLIINTKDSATTVTTAGVGIYWSTKEGKSRGVDLGLEFGGDASNFAMGYTHEW